MNRMCIHSHLTFVQSICVLYPRTRRFDWPYSVIRVMGPGLLKYARLFHANIKIFFCMATNFFGQNMPSCGSPAVICVYGSVGW